MIQHLVLIRWKQNTPNDTIADLLTEMYDYAEIPGVCSIEVAPELGLIGVETRDGQRIEPTGERHALIMAFQDIDALKGFGPNTVHQRVSAKMMPHVADLIIFDRSI